MHPHEGLGAIPGGIKCDPLSRSSLIYSRRPLLQSGDLVRFYFCSSPSMSPQTNGPTRGGQVGFMVACAPRGQRIAIVQRFYGARCHFPSAEETRGRRPLWPSRNLKVRSADGRKLQQRPKPLVVVCSRMDRDRPRSDARDGGIDCQRLARLNSWPDVPGPFPSERSRNQDGTCGSAYHFFNRVA
jgi:hypothetical protein